LRADNNRVALGVARGSAIMHVVPYTLVSFHAHPDDAEIACGGTMARAKAEGHRVVLVIATRGELGEQRPDTITEGESLTDRRVAETFAAAEVLGVDRVEFLGYRDSGMAGESTNDDPDAFWRADVEEAAQRLARLLREEQADVLTVYDDNGGYGHPDHIQVHRVGVRGAELANTPTVYEQTVNRDYIKRLMQQQPQAFEDVDVESRPDEDFVDALGSPEVLITTTVDVRPFAAVKRQALAKHASQVGPESFFLALSDEAFEAGFGYEWYIRRGAPTGARETSLFEHLPD
jgi:LmbE family N-acetylglucosaminyl deacetylase